MNQARGRVIYKPTVRKASFHLKMPRIFLLYARTQHRFYPRNDGFYARNIRCYVRRWFISHWSRTQIRFYAHKNWMESYIESYQNSMGYYIYDHNYNRKWTLQKPLLSNLQNPLLSNFKTQFTFSKLDPDSSHQNFTLRNYRSSI